MKVLRKENKRGLTGYREEFEVAIHMFCMFIILIHWYLINMYLVKR